MRGARRSPSGPRADRTTILNIDSLLLIAGCLLLGWLVGRFGSPPPTLSQGLNWWVINVALTALVMALIPHVQLNSHLWFLFVSMWLVFIGGCVLAVLFGKWLGWTRARIGAVALCAGLGNTALVGVTMMWEILCLLSEAVARRKGRI